MLITQSLGPHVTEPDSALTAAVHKVIAVRRMELCRSDNLTMTGLE